MYRQPHCGPWSLGIGFDTFVTHLPDDGTLDWADKFLAQLGWRRVGEWRHELRQGGTHWTATAEEAS